jgi:hypothetical protein
MVGSLWAGIPWRWNPVQGGDYKGRPAQVLVFTNNATKLYAESIPVNWAGGEDVTDARMEEWISLEGDVAHVRFRFRWNGGIDHPPAHQELPAVFVDYALPKLVHYAGTAPWTGAALTNSVPGWPNESRNIDECWAAFVDQRDWGLGVYVPGQTRITTYRHPGKPGPTGGGCSYFAPVSTMTITNRFDFSYDVYITIGTVDEIRGRFAAVRAARQKASK